MARALRVLTLAVLLAGCATVNRGRFTPLGQAYPPRGEGCAVEIFHDRRPPREFVPIARIDVHIEWSAWFQPRLDDAEPELRKQACLAGADAVIDIDERTGSHIETKRYHVIATGIKYRP